MARPKKSAEAYLPTPETLSEQAARTANAAYKTQKDEPKGAITVLPGGRKATVSQFLDHNYHPGNHTSVFADPHKFMKVVNPTSRYVWASKSEPGTFAKIRSGRYVPVKKEDIRDDTDVPIETHKMAGNEYVAIYDVLLMEVPERAVYELFGYPEAQAVLRTARNQAFNQLRDTVEGETGGYGTAESSFKLD